MYVAMLMRYNADERNHNRSLRLVMMIYHLENLKVNKNKCHFRCIKTLFSVKVISRERTKQDQKKLHVLIEMSHPLVIKKNYNQS